MITDEILNIIKDDYNYNISLLSSLRSEFAQLPHGTLHAKVQKPNYIKYYHHIHSEGERPTLKRIYIKSSNSQLKSTLARKAFVTQSILFLEQSIKIQKKFIELFRPYDPIAIMDKIPKHVRKLHSYTGFKADDYTRNWLQEFYEKSQMLPENLIYSTPSGVMVRSKSESIIAGILEAENIPYRYEAALKLGDRTYFPDFTILLPWSGKIIYWEHFGMADKPEYAGSMLKKLSTYRKNGLFPWYNLIETYESEKFPFDVQRIRMIIHRFLMS